MNAVGFVNKKGVEGDGVSARVDTKYNPTVDAVNYALDSASIMLYQYKVATVGVGLYGDDVSRLRISSLNSVVQRINVGVNLSSAVNFAQVGTLGVHRKDSVNVDVQTNATISARTYAGSAVLPNYDLTIFAVVGATAFSNAGVSLEWVGSDASSVGVAIHNILDTYYTQLQLL